MMESTPEQNKATVLEAFDTLFNKRDYAAAERFWSDRYIQHSAHIAPGRGGLFALGRALPATLRHRPSRPVPRPPVRAAPGLARRSYWIPGSWNLRMSYTDAIPCPNPYQG